MSTVQTSSSSVSLTRLRRRTSIFWGK